MQLKTDPRTKAFTLLELLIVISIISILAVLGLTSFVGAQKKARDARRKADLKSVQECMEQYYVISSYQYENLGTTWPTSFNCGSGGTMNAPSDPMNRSPNVYTINSTATGYAITAKLEDPVSDYSLTNRQ